MGLFGKSQQKDPKEQVNEWTSKIRKEGYQLDRQIRSIQREEEKVKRTLKQSAAKGDKESCVILAKEIVRARKSINRIHTSKAHLNSIQLQMKNQLATLRVAGSLQKSTEVMQAMQRLVKYPELAGIMQDMSKEMMRAGIIEEMLEETMDSIDESEEMEEEAQSEIDKVLWEITEGKLGEAPLPPEATVASTSSKYQEVEEEENDEEEAENELKEMQTRLASLRS
ncbi:CHMP3 family protein [Megaselia abdita]